MEINGEKIMIEGTLLRVAKPHACPQQEWFEDVENPEMLIDALRKSKHRPDILTFWQRLPDTEPKYSYPMELDSIAALPIKSYSFWWEKQIDRKARNKVRKAQKNGVIVRPATFDDRFIEGITSIFNETPIRQGRHYLHYGKDFETVKREFSRFLFREEIFGAYLGEELVGFIMLCNAGRYLFLGQIISKIAIVIWRRIMRFWPKQWNAARRKGFHTLFMRFGLMIPLATSSEAMVFKNLIFPDISCLLLVKEKLALSLGLHRLNPFGLHRGWKRAVPKQIRDPLKRRRSALV